MEKEKTKKVLGWVAVVISSFFTSFWAYWGINENFHEGWYFPNFLNNVILMFGQYLLIPVLFMVLSIVTLTWQKAGGLIHIVLAFAVYFFFGGMKAAFLFIMIPLLGIGIIYYFGIISNKRIAKIILLGIPLLLIIGIGAVQGFRVGNRFNDNILDARQIKGNNVDLVWAPAGPGWPDEGTTWEKAKNICAHLMDDGKTLSDTVQNIWRLPTVDEAVRSMVYHGKNAGGVYNAETKQATYTLDPDKESPLWNIYSKVIYWWTSDEVDSKQAYIVVYNGGIWPRQKTYNLGYLGFRAVKIGK